MILKQHSDLNLKEVTDATDARTGDDMSSPVQTLRGRKDSSDSPSVKSLRQRENVSHESCIHHLFEAQVCRTPQAPALTFQDQHLTYQDINKQVNQLAHYLQKRDVGPGVLVGICLERSIEMIVSILAVLKAGGAYLPLDPAYPSERLRFMLQDSQVQLLLTQQCYIERLPVQSTSLVSLEQVWPLITCQETSNPLSNVTPRDLAYMIYTSGSTGQPKGVMIEHQGLPNMISEQIAIFGLQADDYVAHFASFSFDASVSEMFITFLSGAHLCLVPQENRWPTSILELFLQEQAITAITLPPSALALMHPESLPLLRIVISAGEELSMETVRRWSPGRLLFNAYGPTEGTVCTTIGLCHVADSRPSIGRPIANVQTYLLDHQLQPVPQGAIGELYIGGPGLARGYFNRPELTREKFLPHPFSSDPDARLYRTGDLARLLPDGTIECLGRTDRLVKIRGFRVELGEVEAALERHHLVAQCLVQVYKDRSGIQRLAAYVLLDPRHEINECAIAALPEELVDFVRAYLPKYMRPAKFVVLDVFPLTPSGKIDQNALTRLCDGS